MKKLIRNIYAGISGYKDKDNSYQIKVDFDKNSNQDIIQFLQPYRTKLGDHIYWFGYKYNEGIQDRNLYDKFISFMKTVQEDDSVEYRMNSEGINEPYSPDHLTESELNSMIIRSLNGIGLTKYNIDAIVYPGSSSHNLVQVMIKCIRNYLRNSDRINYTQLNKLSSKNIELVWRIRRFRRNGFRYNI